MVQVAIDRVQVALERTAGNALLTIYRYGSAHQPYFYPEQPEFNLLAVIGDEVDLHELRAGFLPVWSEHADKLRRPPLIASRTAFRRHMQLFPGFAYYLARHGRRVTGARLFEVEPLPPNPLEQASHLAHESLLASSALGPVLLPPEKVEQYRARLSRLARRLNGRVTTAVNKPSDMFADIQTALQEILQSLPDYNRERTVESVDEPNLEAIYQETDHVVMVLPVLAPSLMRQINWDAVAERLEGQERSLQVTTSTQLRLIIQSEAALGFALGRYEHSWGADSLAELQVSSWAMWRSAGRIPSFLLVDELPAAYLAADDEGAVHEVIHDCQNQLLNMRLQHELLHRLHGFAAAAPPEPLPGREESLSVRIDAILNHLDWWAAYYVEQMTNTDLSAKLSAP